MQAHMVYAVRVCSNIVQGRREEDDADTNQPLLSEPKASLG